MRLFVGIDIPDDIRGNLERLLDRLRPTARVKWSPVKNLHITTKFIGEWPEERLEQLRQALRGLPGYAPIPIHIHRVGYFPNPHSPRVFWTGIDAGADLAALAAATDKALASLGIAAEKRPFSPHLTLARIKEPVPLQALRECVAKLPSIDFGSFVADRFYLYQSRLHPSGSMYTKLSEFLLTK